MRKLISTRALLVAISTLALVGAVTTVVSPNVATAEKPVRSHITQTQNP